MQRGFFLSNSRQDYFFFNRTCMHWYFTISFCCSDNAARDADNHRTKASTIGPCFTCLYTTCVGIWQHALSAKWRAILETAHDTQNSSRSFESVTSASEVTESSCSGNFGSGLSYALLSTCITFGEVKYSTDTSNYGCRFGLLLKEFECVGSIRYDFIQTCRCSVHHSCGAYQNTDNISRRCNKVYWDHHPQSFITMLLH
mmetsp:Transcript_33468/g.60290  ORF Transcript_33468/g.60290 Transcript_33468/m.60290 type:complete len:200 (+) Transcript_33468:2285-2884(+)